MNLQPRPGREVREWAPRYRAGSAPDAIDKNVLSPGETGRIVEAPGRHGDMPAVTRRPEQLRSAGRTETPAGHRRRPEPFESSAAGFEVLGRAGRVSTDARVGPSAHGAVTGRDLPQRTAYCETHRSAQTASARRRCALDLGLGSLHHAVRLLALDNRMIGLHL